MTTRRPERTIRERCSSAASAVRVSRRVVDRERQGAVSTTLNTLVFEVTVHALRFLLWSATCRRHSPRRAQGAANARFASIGVTLGSLPTQPKSPVWGVPNCFGATPAGFDGDVVRNPGLRGDRCAHADSTLGSYRDVPSGLEQKTDMKRRRKRSRPEAVNAYYSSRIFLAEPRWVNASPHVRIIEPCRVPS